MRFTSSGLFVPLLMLSTALLTVVETSPVLAQGGELKVTSIEKQVLDLVNQEREKENVRLGKGPNDPSRLKPYLPNAKLFTIARNHAENMAQQNKVDHVLDGKNPINRAKAVGYPNFVGECVAGGQVDPAAAVLSWMNSPPHRSGLLSAKDKEAGIGNAQSADTTNVWCFVFGNSPESNNPPRLVVEATQPSTPSGAINVEYVNDTGSRLNVFTYNSKGTVVKSITSIKQGKSRKFEYAIGDRSTVYINLDQVVSDKRITQADAGKTYRFDKTSGSSKPNPTPPGTTPPDTTLVISVEEKQMLDALNQLRALFNIPALKANSKLFDASRAHASHMARVERMSHELDGKTPNDRVKALDYPATVEEVYFGGGPGIDIVIETWKAKPALMTKILSLKFTEIGIGHATNPDASVWNINLGASPEANNPPTVIVK